MVSHASFHVTGPMFDEVKKALQANVSLEAHLMTDEAKMYNNIGKAFASHQKITPPRNTFVALH